VTWTDEDRAVFVMGSFFAMFWPFIVFDRDLRKEFVVYWLPAFKRYFFGGAA
jgi:hypothetical protein